MPAATLSLLLQLVGALITTAGLGHAAWRVRDVLSVIRSRRRGEVHDVNVAGSTAEAFGSATAVVKKDWSGVPVQEQLVAIHEELRKLDHENQTTANRVNIAERQVTGLRREIASLEARSAQRTDDTVDAAMRHLRDDAKIDLAWDLFAASAGVLLTLVGIVVGFWAI